MWDRVDGMTVRHKRLQGHHGREYLIDGKRVPEGIWKRRYVAQLEAENQQLHEKLAAIYDLL